MLGIHLPFWPVWLAARGMNAAQIGILMSAILWVKVATNPAIAALADRRGERRRPIVLLAAGCLASYGLFVVAEGFWQLLGVSLMAGMFLSAMLPLGENLTVVTARREGFDYGRVRLWGSIAFIAAAAGTGRLLAGRPDELILWLVLGALAAALGAGFLLPDTRFPPASPRGGALRRLMRRPTFVAFLVAGGLLQASHAVYYAFGTIHWRAAGLGDGVIGWLWAEGVGAEILLFAAGARLVRRLGPAGLMLLSGAAGVLRWPLMAWSTDLAMIVALQALHGLTFGAAHLGAMHFIARAAPPEASASAQGLYSAISGGVMFGLAMWASGALYGAFAGNAYYVMAALSLGGAAAAVLLTRLWHGGPLAL